MRHLTTASAIALTTAFTVICFSLSSCSGTESQYTDYVNLKIGTGGHGHVFVGANVPFGMVQLGPTSIPQEWDWCSGYHDSDSTVIGFSHTHLSGTGIGDLFDITVMPVSGEVTFARGNESDPESGLWSYADRSREICRPGYYSVPLTRYGVTAELTATERVGFHRYTFTDEPSIVFDLENGGCWDKATNTFIEPCGEKSLRGWRYSTGWAKDQRVFFYAEFSEPFKHITVIKSEGSEEEPMPRFARIYFNGEPKQILMKVALSAVSTDGAKANLDTELPGWDFDATAVAANEKWNRELSRIKIETKDEAAREIFYTSLFHTMIAPALFSDADGQYRGADGNNYGDPGYKTYTIFSLWDTYRAAMPLYSIFQIERYPEFVNTMTDIFDKQGKLPVWHLAGCETDCMVGNPGIPPVADAMVKGFEGFDYEQAFNAIKQSALLGERGQDVRMEYGYIPYDLAGESVAYDLEYALADAAAANAAEVLVAKYEAAGDTAKAEAMKADRDYFRERSHSYRHLFDKELGFIRGKDSKGNFRKEYSPFSSTHRADDYCEGNGWQYTWLVPHDLEGLAECFGSKEAMLEKLDMLFTVSSDLEGEASPDISGLIGQYAHGNEPSHHIIYFYTIAGQPWKTADKVREVLATMYSNQPDGLSGNEDVGQMSAWYVLSSLGFYEVEPASGRYWFGSPLFDKATIEVEGGEFTIIAKNNSPENKYIKGITLNGKEYKEAYISHSDIKAGGELVLTMGAEY